MAQHRGTSGSGLGNDTQSWWCFTHACLVKALCLQSHCSGHICGVLRLGNTHTEGKSVCTGVTATDFWLNFLRANRCSFPENWGLYGFCFLETTDECCQHFLWMTEQCRKHLIFLVIFSFADQIQSLPLLTTALYKRKANKPQCNNTEKSLIAR